MVWIRFVSMNQSTNRTKIDNISNEIIIEIFDYLRSMDILYSFYNIENKRFQKLINCYTTIIDLTCLSSFKIFSYYCYQIVPFITKNIISLNIGHNNYSKQVSFFIKSYEETRNDSLLSLDFINLKYLKLYFECETDIYPFISLFKNLYELTLITNDINNKKLIGLSSSTSIVFSKIFNNQNSTLNKLSIECISVMHIVQEQPLPSTVCFIKYLTIKLEFYSILFRLIYYIPFIELLNIKINWFDDDEYHQKHQYNNIISTDIYYKTISNKIPNLKSFIL
ncbi:unnamed protein product, partial [Didymodactylos carnosus]